MGSQWKTALGHAVVADQPAGGRSPFLLASQVLFWQPLSLFLRRTGQLLPELAIFQVALPLAKLLYVIRSCKGFTTSVWSCYRKTPFIEA